MPLFNGWCHMACNADIKNNNIHANILTPLPRTPSYLVQLNLSHTGYPELTRPHRLVTLRRRVPRDNSSKCCDSLFRVSVADITGVKRFQKFYYPVKGLKHARSAWMQRANNSPDTALYLHRHLTKIDLFLVEKSLDFWEQTYTIQLLAPLA